MLVLVLKHGEVVRASVVAVAALSGRYASST